jgi:hypothetical protein
MNLDTLVSQILGFYQSHPFPVYAGIAAYILLFIFKRKAALKFLIFLLLVFGVYLVVGQLGESLETGRKNKESMAQKTEKALQ